MVHRHLTGNDHAPTLSISDDMPATGGGGESAPGALEVAASDDDSGDGDGDPDSDRRSRSRSKSSPHLSRLRYSRLSLSHYVGFGQPHLPANCSW